MAELGTLYLLHLEPPLEHARHYLGWTQEGGEAERVAQHLRGSGSPLVRAARRHGREVTLEKAWPGTREDERRHKDGHQLGNLCPRCQPRLREEARIRMARVRANRKRRREAEKAFARGAIGDKVARAFQTTWLAWIREREEQIRRGDQGEFAVNPVDPVEINNGWCYDFAEILTEHLRREGLEPVQLDAGDLAQRRLEGAHVWVWCAGLHYDAESPRGTEFWDRLPFWKRWVEKGAGKLNRRYRRDEERASFEQGAAAWARVRAAMKERRRRAQ